MREMFIVMKIDSCVCLNGKHKCGLELIDEYVAEGDICGSKFSSGAHHMKLKICCLTISYCLPYRKFGT